MQRKIVKFGDFYPRSPCGERRLSFFDFLFLVYYFYPRSPCGERLNTADKEARKRLISIHALLAESDSGRVNNAYTNPISIHALLAESDA